MSRPLQKLQRFFRELKRRNVYKVAATYAIVAFVGFQAANLLIPSTVLPDWADEFFLFLLIIGFPVAVVVAWAFELTPEGVRRTAEAEPAERKREAEAGTRTAYKLLVGIGLVAAAVAGGWYLTGGGGSSMPEPVVPGIEKVDSTRVAVFPFAVRGGEDLEHWGQGMVELLGRSIDGAGSLRAVDPNTLLGRLADRPAEGLTQDTIRRIAARLGAGRYVSGAIYRFGDSLRLSATWYGTDGEEIGSSDVTGGGEGEIQGMVDELARVAIGDLTPGETRRRQQLAAQTTSSVEALKAYVEGQDALRRYDFEVAHRAFSEAVDRDSTFALAHYRLSINAGWSGRNLRLGHRAVRRAVRWSGDLPERERLLVRAYAAYTSGRADEAERLYRTLRQRNPDDAEVAYLLGETLIHFNSVRGRPVTEARGPFRTAMQLDPTFHLPLLHRVQLAVIERDTARLDSLTGRSESRGLAPAYETMLRATRAYLLSSGPDSALAERLRETDPVALMSVHFFLFLWDADRVEATADLLRSRSISDSPNEVRAASRLWRAEVRAGLGRLGEAQRVIEEVESFDSGGYWIARGQLAALPFLPESDQRSRERREVLRGLAAWNAGAVPERLLSHLYLPPRAEYPAGRLYLMGLLRASGDDHAGARQAATLLDSMDGTTLAPHAPADFASAIRAEIDRRQDRPTDALGHLEELKHRADPLLLAQRFHSAARERFLRARLLEQRGRSAEALLWYRTFSGVLWGELPYLAPAHFGRARTLRELGRREEAADAYRRGLELWADADSILQPEVEEARRALARLKSDPTGAPSLPATGSDSP